MYLPQSTVSSTSAISGKYACAFLDKEAVLKYQSGAKGHYPVSLQEGVYCC